MTQPQALYLADVLESDPASKTHHDAAAAELRRLHQFAEEQIGRATAAQAALQMTKATHALKIAAVERQRDALLEALREAFRAFAHDDEGPVWADSTIAKARRAIAAVEGEKE